MKKFQEIIPLGFSCMVAQDLEKLGYRNSSFPFDWVISNFKDVIECIENSFSDMLKEVRQDAEHDNVYHDLNTGVDYYHDFFPNKSIEEQIEEIRKKYERRITRFYEKIKETTLFIRLVRNEGDLRYIEENKEKIDCVLKSYNPENMCIYILSADLAQKTRLEDIFLTKDTNTPVLNCKQLKNFLARNVNISFWKKIQNQIRYVNKAIKKKYGR